MHEHSTGSVFYVTAVICHFLLLSAMHVGDELLGLC